MKIKEFIEKETVRQDRENIYELQFQVLLHIEEGTPLPEWLEYKINKTTERYGIRRGEILADIVKSRLAAVTVAKTANRQCTAENSQIRYLNDYRGVALTKLPSHGTGSMRLLNGDLYSSVYHKHPEATKTLDAIYRNDYIYIKYVKEAGGAQDNQLNDAFNFVKQANQYVKKHDDEKTFTLILDGEYAESKISTFRNYANNRVRVVTSDSY
jgi:hypothetical protein